MKKIFFYKI